MCFIFCTAPLLLDNTLHSKPALSFSQPQAICQKQIKDFLHVQKRRQTCYSGDRGVMETAVGKDKPTLGKLNKLYSRLPRAYQKHIYHWLVGVRPVMSRLHLFLYFYTPLACVLGPPLLSAGHHQSLINQLSMSLFPLFLVHFTISD